MCPGLHHRWGVAFLLHSGNPDYIKLLEIYNAGWKEGPWVCYNAVCLLNTHAFGSRLAGSSPMGGGPSSKDLVVKHLL